MGRTTDAGASPGGMREQAAETARQLASMPEAQKDSEPHRLKQADAVMHALVRNALRRTREGL